ncbi:MAG: phosphate signaling complex protein PhoU [Anaerolineaceae bacterium]
MPRLSLDLELQILKEEVLLLGSLVEQALLSAVEALKQRDVDAARKVELGDNLINEKRYAIENRVITLIATHQPLARDLRFLAAVFEINTELERMGDYAKGIAKVTQRLGEDETPIPIREICRAADLAVSMSHRALEAFINGDTTQAFKIPDEDNQVDDLYNYVYRKLVDSMIANPDSIDQLSLVMWVIHDIERFADRVTNICERTVFFTTGEMLEISSSYEERNEEEDGE